MARNLIGNGRTDQCLNCGAEMEDTDPMLCEECDH